MKASLCLCGAWFFFALLVLLCEVGQSDGAVKGGTMYIETCVQGPDLFRDAPKNSDGVYRKFIEFLQYKLRLDVEQQKEEKLVQDELEDELDQKQLIHGRKKWENIFGAVTDSEQGEEERDDDERKMMEDEIREKVKQLGKGKRGLQEKSVPEFETGVCGGTQIRGNDKYSLIEIASVDLNYNHKAIPSTLNSDFLWTVAESLVQMTAFSGRQEDEGQNKKKSEFIQAGDGRGFFRHLLGDLGFGSLVVSKAPDASSNTLFQLAAQTNNSFNCLDSACSNCPTALFVIIELPGINLHDPQESLYIGLVPAVISEWHLEFPQSGSTDDIRERIHFDFGSIVYAYGTAQDVFGLFTPEHASATCNLDMFCFTHPCLCAPNDEKRGCIVYGGSVLGRKEGEANENDVKEENTQDKKEEEEEEELEMEDKTPMRKGPRKGVQKFLSDIYLPYINWYQTPVFGCRSDFGC